MLGVMLSKKTIELDQLQTHKVPFSGINDAYHLLEQKDTKAIKVFVDLD